MVRAATQSFRIIALTSGIALAACARPDGFSDVPTENAVSKAVTLSPADVAIEVAPATGEAADDIARSLELYLDEIAITSEDGVKTRAVVRIDDFDLVPNTVRALTGQATEMSGEVKLIDAETGAVLVPPTPISVDARAIIYSDDFGVITRDRVETKAQKLSRQFMKRARIALYGPGV
ncbi:MAG: hypothetical protein AAFP78_00815 [Pseudomonadota bacterium]